MEGSASPDSGLARLEQCGSWPLSGVPGSPSRRSPRPSSGRCSWTASACHPRSAPRRSLAYDLRKLRGKGLVRKVDGRHRYTLTDLGYRVAGYWTKLHQRLLTPTLDSLEATLRPVVAASAHPLDHALTRLNASFDDLAQLAGLKFAA